MDKIKPADKIFRNCEDNSCSLVGSLPLVDTVTFEEDAISDRHDAYVKFVRISSKAGGLSSVSTYKHCAEKNQSQNQTIDSANEKLRACGSNSP